MAIVINGSGTITGISTGGLPDGIVDDGTLATSAVTSTKIADGTITDSDVNTAKIVVKDASGNVGIGTTSPSYKVTIADSNTDGKHIRMENGSEIGMLTLDDSGDIRLWAHGSATKIVTGTGTGSTTATFDSAGNMGLGVTPESGISGDVTELDIGLMSLSMWKGESQANDGASFGYNCYKTGGLTYKAKRSSSGGDWSPAVYEQVYGQHRFRVASSATADSAISWTTAMTIDNSGQIRAGDLQDSLQPGRGISCSGNGYASLRVRRGSDSGACVEFYGSSSTSSNVGSIYVTGSSTSYNESSDYRLKENVEPMSGSIDKLKQLKPCNFNFIVDPDDLRMGFLAHEVSAVVPQAISGEKDAMMMEEYEVTPAVKDDDDNVITEAVMGEREVPDYQGIDQAKLVPLLTSALQDAIAKIEQLESRISALEVS
jgi:hypothetical protein